MQSSSTSWSTFSGCCREGIKPVSRYAVYFFGILSSSNINTPVARIFCYIYRCVMCSTVWWRQCEADVAVMDGASPSLRPTLASWSITPGHTQLQTNFNQLNLSHFKFCAQNQAFLKAGGRQRFAGNCCKITNREFYGIFSKVSFDCQSAADCSEILRASAGLAQSSGGLRSDQLPISWPRLNQTHLLAPYHCLPAS